MDVREDDDEREVKGEREEEVDKVAAGERDRVRRVEKLLPLVFVTEGDDD
jgi:hypothetical protein